jgi:hypothetical protein
MRIDTRAIRPIATLDAATRAIPRAALPQATLGTPAMRWAAMAATLVTIAAVLLACGLAVVMNLS